MIFGLSSGEIVFVAFLFALIYGAGFLPKIAARLAGSKSKPHD